MDKQSHGHLVAIDDVELEASFACESEIRWFYGEFITLKTLPDSAGTGDTPVLRFKSERFELRISITDSPTIDSLECKAHFVVPSMHDALEILRERKYAFRLIHGLSFTDRAIDLLDPAGNRVEVRRLWAGFPIRSPGGDL